MKKTITVLLTLIVVTATASPVLAGGGRGYRHCGGYCGDSGDVWVAAGIGLLTGVVLSAILNPPPPRTVVYASPAPTALPPAPAAAQGYAAGAPGAVSVNVEALNVRSGPGLYQGIIGRVRYGEVLTVIGTSPGWINVRTPGGSIGWVMARYTASPAG
jgi:uncharacterized protein YgiM (DUF1202 family)